ncbi:hypothetical protein FRACYDRAFT_277859 [Fragilariopsis cylindrus CCMP1102]|uniref:CGL160/ATPI domain-containing protein n=1 Tax=Fragilariopsis cylindrus CCMP1102 TaxID=635003 RepID=A0A1E7EMX0_9STRA|nr:hypothetical protein FRACYDRAFT_277859 [Fragilariopsis cylindrus CCMP1102]|eukprot:OEU07280.1 hypothetical protein FRACYDRAFT_277859 [Fragilariopsis cylindrus CCMP1102]
MSITSSSGGFVLFLLLLLLAQSPVVEVLAFNQHQHQLHYGSRIKTTTTTTTTSNINRFVVLHSSSNNNNNNNSDSQNQKQATPQPYIPISTARPLEDGGLKTKKKSSLHPKTGDIVRYYDLDGGNTQGEVLVGKIAYVFGSKSYKTGFSVELNELENVGDGYYAEYSSTLRNRNNRKTERFLIDVSPIAASFVGSEQAYKIPLQSSGNNLPKVRQNTYDIDDYEGPAFYANINKSILEKDYENYSQLKIKLFRNVLVTGLFGTIISNASYGLEDSIIYFSGILSSILYLYLLSIKTDTVSINDEDNSKNLIGTPIANLRFGTPILLLIGISIYNIFFKMSSGLSDDNLQIGLFDTVSAEQFGAAVLGFLTYRVPLFFGQIRDAFQQMAMKMLLLASYRVHLPKVVIMVKGFTLPGSAATGRSELVQQLLQDSSTSSSNMDMNMNLVEPNLIFRRNDGATFERLERRDEFLYVDESQSSGFTIEGIMNAAKGDIDTNDSTDNDNDNESTTIEIPNKNVIVIDANVELAKRISQSVGSNVRIIGVWIGLKSVKDFEYNIQQQIDTGLLKVDESIGAESFMRGKIKDIITEIDFGLGSGIFEFTILNEIEQNNTDGTNKSLMELKEAASYAFK